MLLRGTKSNSSPPRVILEELNNAQRVILSDNVREIEETLDLSVETGKQNDDEEDVFEPLYQISEESAINISYEYDEVVFFMPSDRKETIQSIEENFEQWWEFGQQDTQVEPDLEQRVSDLEDIIISLMEG